MAGVIPRHGIPTQLAGGGGPGSHGRPGRRRAAGPVGQQPARARTGNPAARPDHAHLSARPRQRRRAHGWPAASRAVISRATPRWPDRQGPPGQNHPPASGTHRVGGPPRERHLHLVTVGPVAAVTTATDPPRRPRSPAFRRRSAAGFASSAPPGGGGAHHVGRRHLDLELGRPSSQPAGSAAGGRSWCGTPEGDPPRRPGEQPGQASQVPSPARLGATTAGARGGAARGGRTRGRGAPADEVVLPAEAVDVSPRAKSDSKAVADRAADHQGHGHPRRRHRRRRRPARATMARSGSGPVGVVADTEQVVERHVVRFHTSLQSPQRPVSRSGISKHRSSMAPQGVLGVEARRRERPAPLAPRRWPPGRHDAAVHLQDAALEHPVLGPAAREVLGARHLDPGERAPVAGQVAPFVAVGVAGEVADQGRPARRPRPRGARRPRRGPGHCPARAAGAEHRPPARRSSTAERVMTEDHDRPIGPGGQLVEPLGLARRRPHRRPSPAGTCPGPPGSPRRARPPGRAAGRAVRTRQPGCRGCPG